jgi:hypothetical protein
MSIRPKQETDIAVARLVGVIEYPNKDPAGKPLRSAVTLRVDVF